LSFGLPVVRNGYILSACKLERAETVTALFQRQVEGANRTRRHQLLGDYVRRLLRTPHTKVLGLDHAEQRIRTKSDFHKTVEVNREVDATCFAMKMRTDLAQRAFGFLRPAT
jgi:hypothetical protein